MARSTAVAERETPKVPDLVRTPALQLTADDIALPRIYVGQFMSAAVQDQLVKAGQIFAATGGDDPEPNVLWSPPFDIKTNPGVLFHVLSIIKKKSYSDGGELMLFDFDDPNAPEGAWTTYNYVLLLPEIDEDVPFKLLLTRSARQTALKINTVLVKHAIKGPSWECAFRLTASERENAKGKFYVAQVTSAVADKANVDRAAELASSMEAATTPSFQSSGEQPAI